MAAVVGLGPLPVDLRTSARDPLCERINKVAWRSIWPFALAIGAGLGGLATWAFSFDPILTLTVAVGFALFVATIYFAFQWPLPYEIPQGFEMLEDASTLESFRKPVISTHCGHTADRSSADAFINRGGGCTTGGCKQVFEKKGDLVPNRLITGLLNVLHKKQGVEADRVFHAFVEDHKDESMVLPDGRSTDVLQQVLLMRARDYKLGWSLFCNANAKDLYREGSTKYYRTGVDKNVLFEALNKPGEYDAQLHMQLEDLYKQSVYNWTWQHVVDKYSEEKA